MKQLFGSLICFFWAFVGEATSDQQVEMFSYLKEANLELFLSAPKNGGLYLFPYTSNNRDWSNEIFEEMRSISLLAKKDSDLKNKVDHFVHEMRMTNPCGLVAYFACLGQAKKAGVCIDAVTRGLDANDKTNTYLLYALFVALDYGGGLDSGDKLKLEHLLQRMRKRAWSFVEYPNFSKIEQKLQSQMLKKKNR